MKNTYCWYCVQHCVRPCFQNGRNQFANTLSLFQFARAYYKRVTINLEDVRAKALSIKANNLRDNVYVDGKYHKVGGDQKGCCNYQYMVLNSYCVSNVSDSFETHHTCSMKRMGHLETLSKLVLCFFFLYIYTNKPYETTK